MAVDADEIRAIVERVLAQLQPANGAARSEAPATRPAEVPQNVSANQTTQTIQPSQTTLWISENVVTQTLLSERLDGQTRLQVPLKAIVTPSALDWLRARRVQLERVCGQATAAKASFRWLMLVGTPAPALEAVLAHFRAQGLNLPRELGGTPNELADRAVSALCRSEVDGVALATSEPHRVACRANRQPRVRAVALERGTDGEHLRQSLAPNLVAFAPHNKSFSEIRNVLKPFLNGRPQPPPDV